MATDFTPVGWGAMPAAHHAQRAFEGSYPDTVLAGSYPDTVLAGSYPDTMLAGSYPDTMLAGSYPDTVLAGSYPGTMLAGSYPDTMLAGTPALNVMPCQPCNNDKGAPSLMCIFINTFYRHYMAQLDDRDQLARRVSELARQEQKLLLRCTAIEQERSALTDKVGALTTAVAEGQEAQSKLRHRLQQMESDRDEAVRHNLNLQRKLTTLEEGHSALSSAHKEQAAALEASMSQAAQLVKENKQLHATAEKLQASMESRRLQGVRQGVQEL
eukprot:gene6174-6412_t